jgi:HTH-type transcriptional regulator/antitoxin HipB
MEALMNSMARSAKQLGFAIQQQRQAKNLTQVALANLIGTGQKTISKIETGNGATRADTVFAVLAALNLELEVRPRNEDIDSDLLELLTK